MIRYLIIVFLIAFSILSAQSDTTTYPWPTPNFNSSRGLTATFGEFRNTGSADHFHNAVDIGEPDGNPVYPCINGTVHYLSNNGYDSYINVKSIINGEKKHITYYHVVPSPTLSIGQSVTAGNTVIGNIYVGAAHVHLIEREFTSTSSSNLGIAINPARPEGGLKPYYDTDAPVIDANSLKFYKDNSSSEISSNLLKGKIDIRIEVKEINGIYSSQQNNGTYILGYRILSEDGNQIAYEPEYEGKKYRFYFLPNDGYVHNVFVKGVATLSKPLYWLTNGSGEKDINESLVISNNFLDADLLDEGNYLLEIFAEDTRANKTSKQFPISVIKSPPELNTVLSSNDTIKISWSEYKSNKLKGYRIYYSDFYLEDSWKLAADENQINEEITGVNFSTGENFLNPTTSKKLKFYITAVDSSGIESQKSDTYSLIVEDSDSPNLLIVDGFDRYGGTGSWIEPNHEFNLTYTVAAIHNKIINVSSSSNEAVILAKVDLKDYDMVIWFVGDESIADNTFINEEQNQIAQYLGSGGKFFVSGEDIGQDLETDHSFREFSDALFYNHYLKAELIHDGLDILFEVNGEPGSIFENMNVQFGEAYEADAPDDIEPINGSEPIFNYTYMRDDTTYRKGGIAYKGTFGDSTNIGSMVYLSFPFETIGNEDSRNQLMAYIINYLELNVVDVNEEENYLLNNFYLDQNYPNPFNPTTIIRYSIPVNEKALKQPTTLKIYDVLGKEVVTLVNRIHKAGSYEILFDASNLSSGVYFYQLRNNNFIESKKMILIK